MMLNGTLPKRIGLIVLNSFGLVLKIIGAPFLLVAVGLFGINR